MTQQKIAGFDIDEVIAQEEARLKAEREAAEAERRRQELEQRRAGRKPRPATTSTPATPPAIIPAGSLVIPYRGIEFEHRAYRAAEKADKTLLSYDASLARLRAAGFERHARPREVFGLLIDGLEKKLTVQEISIYEGQLTNYGEWLSLVFERQGERLITYLDPEGLEWEEDKYVKTRKFKHAEKRDFDINGKVSQQYITLNQFPDDLVQFLYGRSFAALPQEMREGSTKARLSLPSDKTAWPVARGIFGGRYNVNGNSYSSRASRGVRGMASAQKK